MNINIELSANSRLLCASDCRRQVKPNLLIIDEFGMRNLPTNAAEELLEIFHRRYQFGANIIATNRPIEDWGKILGDNATTSVVLDRFMDHIHFMKITGRSYRVKTLNKNLDKNNQNH